ncbi:hydantoinase B/oxoprolinase family protein [Xenophilus arseniciresistens]|uniref:Hydantoinase B/oxoprolinase family protein n=1 Tax=Xenophilus arseniciresistens TaxID=1283306 RepID=A0AAE3T1W3_9BURK|nr:hydantoinase B/oxoprolinase family protein [Xenophilus arseniciresistens]MDA7417802.1 hydantoinase B/oxoprolinase family protein [Xenophilus arseniciresistens]
MSSQDVVLICTEGFSDVMTLARQHRADPYMLHVPASPWPQLLPADWRIEASGRMDASGTEVQPLAPEAVLQAMAALPRPPRAVAISLLFAHRNPTHELALAHELRTRWPDLPVVCSHEHPVPEGGEYERTRATLAAVGLTAPAPQQQQAAPALAGDALPLQLEALANRMQQRLVREAVSSVVREAMDCATAIFLPDGRLVAQARTLPLLLGSLSPAVKGLLAAFACEDMREGDGYLLNDPWHGGTHLPDLTLMRPVFVDGRVVALVACMLHHQDVGGIAPGSVPTHATSIQQEGLRVPPMQLYAGGQVDAALLRLLCANSRMPDNLSGDLHAQWLGLSQGADELAALWRAEPAMAQRCGQALQAAQDAARAALRAAPDGDYVFEDALDGDGLSPQPVRVAVRILKRGEQAMLDFTGCADQTPGPVNASRAAVQAAVAYFAHMLAPQAPCNDGSTAVLTLRTRPGSIVDPLPPAAVNARTNLVKLLANALLGAWSQALPAQMPAPNAAEVVVLSLGGTRPDGKPWLLTEIIASAAGGAPWGAGGSGVSTDVGNARNTPAEAIEAQAPLRVERVAVRAGSGGSGTHRGGDGVLRIYRLLHGSGSISYRGERHQIAPQGAAGGAPGACAAARILRASGEVEHLGAKARAHWQAGDRLVIETAGGGGWGSAQAQA